jgi:hypothetical protein
MRTSRIAEFFQGLSGAVAPEKVRLSGAWAGRSQRRYASLKQSGTGEGPFIDVVDWRWEGTLEGDSPLVGLALLVTDERFYWVKSHPPADRPQVSFSMARWAGIPGSVSATGSFHGAYLPSLPIDVDEEPPVACILGDSAVKAGTPHFVVQVKGVALAVVLLPASAIKVGRNRLWHLRETIAARLRPRLSVLLTRGRSGRIDPRVDP